MEDELSILQGKLARVASAIHHFVPSSANAQQLRRDMRELLAMLEARKQQ